MFFYVDISFMQKVELMDMPVYMQKIHEDVLGVFKKNVLTFL